MKWIADQNADTALLIAIFRRSKRFESDNNDSE